MIPDDIFSINKGNIYAVPILHYSMEFACQVHLAVKALKPDCVAVELAETMQLQMLHAASRLPDISIVVASGKNDSSLYYLCEPCDGAFEGLRCAMEDRIPAFCIDLDVDEYPNIRENLPDPYAIQRIGLKSYYEIYTKNVHARHIPEMKVDLDRELFMARKLKELSLRYERILFVGGMAHVENVLKLTDSRSFPELTPAKRDVIQLCTLSEKSCREVMAEFGWISKHYEDERELFDSQLGVQSSVGDVFFPPDRQKLIYQLYRESGEHYKLNTGHPFPGYNLRNIMKYARNYALIDNKLMPDIFQILTAAKGCVDHNYAYETWVLATEYPYRKNIDQIQELDLTADQVWGNSKLIHFQLKQQGRKDSVFHTRRKDHSQFRFEPPGPFSICSYPAEDVVVENFGKFLQKKGTQIFSEEGARTVPFSTSLEDGIDTKETIRHWHERKLYVKVKGKPPGGVGSVVIIFDEDKPREPGEKYEEKYPWRTSWLGEHEQESDMAFYATQAGKNMIGPGISRCEYGGFMMSYPPRRLLDIWQDPDYEGCRSKSEVLLVAAIDYAIKPVIVYVAGQPPRNAIKNFAKRFGKKVIYIPIGQLSPVTLNKLRVFHVLDGHDKRKIADEYIF